MASSSHALLFGCRRLSSCWPCAKLQRSPYGHEPVLHHLVHRRVLRFQGDPELDVLLSPARPPLHAHTSQSDSRDRGEERGEGQRALRRLATRGETGGKTHAALFTHRCPLSRCCCCACCCACCWCCCTCCWWCSPFAFALAPELCAPLVAALLLAWLAAPLSPLAAGAGAAAPPDLSSSLPCAKLQRLLELPKKHSPYCHFRHSRVL